MTHSPSPITLLPTHTSHDCQSWSCITRELEHHSQTSNAIAEHPDLPPRRQPSALLMAAGIMTVILIGSATLMQIQQASVSILTGASADFTHQNF
ncbi:MAG: hypothetical protein AAGF75_09270 [Cyanobacteria bacterium P01_H01_bin.130]